MPRQPAARASAARDNLNFVDVYRPGALAEVRSRIPAESLEVIDNAPSASWLDFEYDHLLMDEVMFVLGREDAIACWHQSIGHLIDRPLLRNFVEGGLRIFGARPGKIIKLIPKGWTLAYRDFCAPAFELLEEGKAEIRFHDIAPEAFDSVGYLYCWYAICQGVFDLEKPVAGQVDFEFDRDAREAVATFCWTP
jgi:hypothetical protein